MGLSTGLKAYYEMDNVGGSSAVDKTINGNDIALTDTVIDANGVPVNANGEYGTIVNTANKVVSPDLGTLIINFDSNVVPNDGLVHGLIANYGPTLEEGDFYLLKFSDDRLYFNFRDDVGIHYIGINHGKLTNWTTGIQIAVVWNKDELVDDNYNIAFYINGSYVEPDVNSGATSWNSYTIKNLALLNDLANTNRHADGNTNFLAVFNTEKTASELSIINGNHNLILADYLKKNRQKLNLGIGIGL